jgi:hypothetical protein
MTEVKRYFQVQVWRRWSGVLRTGVILAVSLLALPDAWALDAIPTMLSFQAVQGGTSPSSQILNILKKNPRTLSWSSNKNAMWLGVSPMTGSITDSAQISVSVNPTGLAAGTYMGTVTVSVTKGGNISVPVTLTVTSGSTTSSTSTTLSSSSGTTATLSWGPSTSTNVAGYKVYVGTASGVYSSSITVGSATTYTVSNLGVASTYYFAVAAYNTSGIESSFSNEVSKSIY